MSPIRKLLLGKQTFWFEPVLDPHAHISCDLPAPLLLPSGYSLPSRSFVPLVPAVVNPSTTPKATHPPHSKPNILAPNTLANPTPKRNSKGAVAEKHSHFLLVLWILLLIFGSPGRPFSFGPGGSPTMMAINEGSFLTASQGLPGIKVSPIVIPGLLAMGSASMGLGCQGRMRPNALLIALAASFVSGGASRLTKICSPTTGATQEQSSQNSDPGDSGFHWVSAERAAINHHQVCVISSVCESIGACCDRHIWILNCCFLKRESSLVKASFELLRSFHRGVSTSRSLLSPATRSSTCLRSFWACFASRTASSAEVAALAAFWFANSIAVSSYVRTAASARDESTSNIPSPITPKTTSASPRKETDFVQCAGSIPEKISLLFLTHFNWRLARNQSISSTVPSGASRITPRNTAQVDTTRQMNHLSDLCRRTSRAGSENIRDSVVKWMMRFMVLASIVLILEVVYVWRKEGGISGRRKGRIKPLVP